MTQAVLAIVPARGGSRGFPGKNLAPLAGKPLLAHAIDVARSSRTIGRVVVTTDSEEIRSIALAHGAEAPFLRPPELARDETVDLPVFVHCLEWLATREGYRPEVVVHLRPTTPLRRPEVIDLAVEALLKDPEADSVRCVVAPSQNPFKMWRRSGKYLEPLLRVEGVAEPYNEPRQRLPEVLWQTGYVDVVRPRTILELGSMTGRKILPIVRPDRLVVDIDDPAALELAEFLHGRGRY